MAGILTLSVMTCWVLVCVIFRTKLRDAWREPVMCRPVVVLESDDWGPADESHAGALTEISDCLRAFTDRDGRHPVMTLGIVLATVDVERLKANADGAYARVTLADVRVRGIRDAMRNGVADGVFALQLHGIEHYRTETLLAVSDREPSVRQWLHSRPFPDTEELPSHLQSRWTNASTLPSRDLETTEVDQGVREEVALFEAVFDQRPRVYVPTTFVWPIRLEEALAREGLEALITPGFRCSRRAADGSPEATNERYFNGDCRYGALRYLVRDIYFEPVMGHTAARTMEKVRTNAALGRPALLETHRINFTQDDEQRAASLDQLRQLLTDASGIPGMAFVSSLDLARSYAGTGPLDIEMGPERRLGFALRRMLKVGRFRKLAWLTGLAFAIYPLIYFLGRPRTATAEQT